MLFETIETERQILIRQTMELPTGDSKEKQFYFNNGISELLKLALKHALIRIFELLKNGEKIQNKFRTIWKNRVRIFAFSGQSAKPLQV